MNFAEFVSPNFFADVVSDPEEAKACSDRINKTLIKHCMNVYGLMGADGKAIDFCSVRKVEHNHTGLLLFPTKMAAFQPEQIEIKEEKTDDSAAIIKSQEHLLKQLRSELAILNSEVNRLKGANDE